MDLEQSRSCLILEKKDLKQVVIEGKIKVKKKTSTLREVKNVVY